MMSSTSSMPTERRTRPSEMPTRSCIALGMEAWVIMAGREMTAWIAGLSFISANLGSLEMMGWAGSTYQYGILALHAYWIGAIPAIL